MGELRRQRLYDYQLNKGTLQLSSTLSVETGPELTLIPGYGIDMDHGGDGGDNYDNTTDRMVDRFHITPTAVDLMDKTYYVKFKADDATYKNARVLYILCNNPLELRHVGDTTWTASIWNGSAYIDSASSGLSKMEKKTLFIVLLLYHLHTFNCSLERLPIYHKGLILHGLSDSTISEIRLGHIQDGAFNRDLTDKLLPS